MHELVVIRLVSGRARKLRDTGLFRELDPNLGYQNALHIKTDNVHVIISSNQILAYMNEPES